MALIIGRWTQLQSGSSYVAWADADHTKLAAPFRNRLIRGETMEILEYLPDVSGDVFIADEFGEFVSNRCRIWRQHLNGS